MNVAFPLTAVEIGGVRLFPDREAPKFICCAITGNDMVVPKRPVIWPINLECIRIVEATSVVFFLFAFQDQFSTKFIRLLLKIDDTKISPAIRS